jgi:lycopene beta-cyclase
MTTEYLIVLGLILVVPLSLSFNRHLLLYKSPRRLFGTLLFVCVPFWIWDVIATARGHWSFNPSYVLGIVFLGLPLEEWLFFAVIAFVSVFTWESIKVIRRSER